MLRHRTTNLLKVTPPQRYVAPSLFSNRAEYKFYFEITSWAIYSYSLFSRWLYSRDSYVSWTNPARIGIDA